MRAGVAPPKGRAALEGQLLPDQQLVFAEYAGSASCRDCHPQAFEDWQVSVHARAERPLEPGDLAAFDPPRSFHHGTQDTEARLASDIPQVVTMGPNGQPAPFPIERVIGDDPLRQFLVPFPRGRSQVLEASFDPHRNEWFNVYGDEDRRAGEWGHWTGRGMNWNNMCAGCHNTRLRKNYDPVSDSYATAMVEATVACEACHGPMKKHVEWRRAHPDAKPGTDPTYRSFTPDQMLESCAACHARRFDMTSDFAPGDLFDDHFSLTIVDDTDVYYPDGQVREEDYEYAAFLGSRLHAKGVRCNDCHEPHTARVRFPGNALCMTCHTGPNSRGPAIDPAAHSFHQLDPLYTAPAAGGPDLAAIAARDPETVAKSAGECISCHMPQTFYMQRQRRHDHGFTIPDPLLTKELGIPNACNRCHTDKDADWAISWTDQWYGSRMDRPSRRRTRTIAAARHADSTAAPGLIAVLTGDEPAYWKAVAANLLTPWADRPEVNSALTLAAKSESSLVRASAARAFGPLAELGARGPDQTLRLLLDDPVRSVRFHAAWALRAGLDPASAPGRELLDIITIASDQPTGRMQWGAYLMSRADAAGALPHYRLAAQWDPNSAPIRHDLAIVASTLGLTDEAITHLEKACELEPTVAEFPFKLALAYHEAGRTDRTIEALQTAVRLDPTHARAWYNLGLALNSVGRTAEALEALDRAAAAAPNDAGIAQAREAIRASR